MRLGSQMQCWRKGRTHRSTMFPHGHHQRQYIYIYIFVSQSRCTAKRKKANMVYFKFSNQAPLHTLTDVLRTLLEQPTCCRTTVKLPTTGTEETPGTRLSEPRHWVRCRNQLPILCFDSRWFILARDKERAG